MLSIHFLSNLMEYYIITINDFIFFNHIALRTGYSEQRGMVY